VIGRAAQIKVNVVAGAGGRVWSASALGHAGDDAKAAPNVHTGILWARRVLMPAPSPAVVRACADLGWANWRNRRKGTVVNTFLSGNCGTTGWVVGGLW
jgi:hypothetical protein